LPIAIVIEVVLARFGAWSDFAGARTPRSPSRITRLRSVLANAHAQRTGRTRITTPRREWSANAATLVDLPIAIVIIGSTAIFAGSCRHVLYAIERPRRTRQCASRTNAEVACAANCSAARITIVVHSIAIVIDSVADFGVWLSRRTYACLSIVTTGHGNGARAHSASNGSNAIVRQSIAIVIDSVADFCVWLSWRTRARLAIVTARNGGGARAHSAGNGSNAIVRQSITIVIDSVADFSDWLSRRTYARLAIVTTGHGNGARAHSAGNGSNRVVDRSITIVIDSVACFVLRRDFTFASAPGSRATRLRPGFARTHVQRRHRSAITVLRGAIFARATIVDDTVAIFVQKPIAGFDSRRIRFAF